MTLLEIKNQMISNNLDSVYYLTGDEWKVMNIYIHKIADVAKKEIVYVDSILDIIDTLKMGKTLVTPKCYVITNDTEFMTNEKAWNNINDMTGDNIIIFVSYQIDKRSKFYKKFKDKLVVFDKLNEQTLITYCQKDVRLNETNLRLLIKLCDYDYGKILNEINKINNCNDEPNLAFAKLRIAGLINEPMTTTVFDLIDAILCRSASVYEVYEKCKANDVPTLSILANLFTQTKQVLQVQTYEGGNIEKATGLTSWQVSNIRNKVNRYSREKLIDIMRVSQKVEIGIKQGKIDESIAIDYVLERILT